MLLDRRQHDRCDTCWGSYGCCVFDADKNETTWTLTYDAKAKTQLWSGYKMGATGKPGPLLLDEITTGTEFKTRGRLVHDSGVGW